LAILKDDEKLWVEIFSNRELRRFIESKHCKKILIVAGGHGSEIDVLVDMFGIDIIDKIVYNDKYSFFCNQIKRKYPSITVVKGDFIIKEFNMKFDVVVGNPPFQSTEDGSKRKKMWVQFAKKAMELADVVAFVTPSAWQKENSKYFKDIAEQIEQNLVVYKDANAHFIVGEDIGYWIVDKNSSNIVSVINNNPCFPIYNKMLKVNKDDKWHYRDFQQPHALENKKKLLFPATPTNDFNVPIYWTAKQVRYCRQKDVKYTGWKVIVNNSGHIYDATNLDKYSKVDNSMTVGLGAWGIKVENEEEGNNVLTWVRSKLYRVVVTKIKTGGFNNPFIELKSLGVKKAWTDEEIYKYFNLTDDEIKYIEDNAN
jgi:hypothetical protein